MIDGTGGPMEALMWFYAKGEPVERVEQVERFPHAHLSDEELRLRLLESAKELTPKKIEPLRRWPIAALLEALGC